MFWSANFDTFSNNGAAIKTGKVIPNCGGKNKSILTITVKHIIKNEITIIVQKMPIGSKRNCSGSIKREEGTYEK